MSNRRRNHSTTSGRAAPIRPISIARLIQSAYHSTAETPLSQSLRLAAPQDTVAGRGQIEKLGHQTLEPWVIA